jgi:uncharacterized protein
LLLAPPPSPRASNVPRQNRTTEKLICSDAEVSALDEALSVEYKRAYALVEDKSGLRQSQRDWLSSYALSGCSVASCLKKEISERIVVLNQVSAVGEPASRWTGHFVRYWKGKEDKDKASIAVLGLKTGRLFITGKALWFGPNASIGQVNDGAMKGYSNHLAPGSVATFDSDIDSSLTARHVGSLCSDCGQRAPRHNSLKSTGAWKNSELRREIAASGCDRRHTSAASGHLGPGYGGCDDDLV